MSDGLDWARGQLAEAGYEHTHVAHLTRKVHEALVRYAEADPDGTADAAPVIAALLQGLPLGEELWSEKKRAARTFTWKPVMPNSLQPGDVVRVRRDAYEGQMAAHNGRTGRVSALRGGVVVNYDGVPTMGTRMGVRHPSDKLERQVPIRTTTTTATKPTRRATQ